MKYDGLEKKVAELFPGFKLETVKSEFVFTRYDRECAEKFGIEVDDEAYTEITITGFVKEEK